MNPPTAIIAVMYTGDVILGRELTWVEAHEANLIVTVDVKNPKKLYVWKQRYPDLPDHGSHVSFEQALELATEHVKRCNAG